MFRTPSSPLRWRLAPQLRAGLAAGLVALVALASSGCSNRADTDKSDAAAASAQPAAAEDSYRQLLSLVDNLPLCDVDHRGLLLDMGSDALVGRHARWLDTPKGIVGASHDGASWARVYERSVKLRFVLPRSTKVFVSLRAIGRDSKRASVIVDNFVLSHLSLKRDAAQTLKTRVSGLPLDAGEHMVEVRFRGYRRNDNLPFAEVDWVRIGVPDNIERTYSAPTLNDLVASSAQLGGVPHQAIALHGPALVRCALKVPPHARLRTSVGFSGDGNGLAEFVARDASGDTHVLDRVEVRGGDTATWSEIDASMHELAGRIISLEMRVPRTSGSGRLLLGDPNIAVPKREPPVLQQAKRVVVVLLNGVSRSDLPPWSKAPSPHLPTLSELARSAVVFDNHRASSSLVSASVASALSGLDVWQHGLRDGGAALPKTVRTAGQQAGEASVRAALFSAVPLASKSFGFADHWEKFMPFPPNQGRLCSAPYEEATNWLLSGTAKQERKMLAFVVAKGGHPPWDVTPKEALELPPEEYAGSLTPRRAAQQLRDVGGRFSRLSDADRERMRALFLVSLSRQDAALGAMIAALKEQNMWDDTLLIVSADVASSRDQLFRDGGDLREQVLTLPLYVHFPHDKRAPQRVSLPSEQTDLAFTALTALGLKPAADSTGRHLEELAAGHTVQPRHMRLAITDDRYSLRWSDYVLHGAINKRPKLCRVDLDPVCAFDRRHLHPFVTEAMFRQLAQRHKATKQAPARLPLSLDTEAAGTLEVWGAN